MSGPVTALRLSVQTTWTRCGFTGSTAMCTFGPKYGATEAATAGGMRNARIAAERRTAVMPSGIMRGAKDTGRSGCRSIAGGAPQAPAVLDRLFNRRGLGIETENKLSTGSWACSTPQGGHAIVRPICSLRQGHHQSAGQTVE